jgi:hypothetical protein
VSYQLFQSSSMRWPPSSARPPAIKYTLSKGRAFAHKNTMLRFVACVLIARQHDLCRTGIGSALPFGRPACRARVDYGRRAVSRPAERVVNGQTPDLVIAGLFPTPLFLHYLSSR